MFKARLTFSDHTPGEKRELILGGLKALGDGRELDHQSFEFDFKRDSKSERAKNSLVYWSSEGWLHWWELP